MPIIVLVDDWEEGSPPDPAVRWDLAWPLFLPHTPGDLPRGHGKELQAIARWYWDTMGYLGGFLRQPRGRPIWHLLPRGLKPAGRDMVIRLASFWADEVYQWPAEAVRQARPQDSPNLWVPPVTPLLRGGPSGSLAERLTDTTEDGGTTRFLMPMLGVGRAFFRVEIIPPGKASARLHSHSAVDEYYLILEGRGTLRMASHHRPVAAGDLIAKPTGPDLTSHIVADVGESVTILDMEIWPDTSFQTKDFVHYPDFGEMLWRGAGWAATAPDTALSDPADFRQHYDDGYRRRPDGGWTPEDIPGAPPRTVDGFSS
jgi:uncharacterized cupin superfamily protein